MQKEANHLSLEKPSASVAHIIRLCYYICRRFCTLPGFLPDKYSIQSFFRSVNTVARDIDIFQNRP